MVSLIKQMEEVVVMKIIQLSKELPMNRNCIQNKLIEQFMDWTEEGILYFHSRGIQPPESCLLGIPGKSKNNIISICLCLSSSSSSSSFYYFGQSKK